MGRTIFDMLDDFFSDDFVRPTVVTPKRAVAPMCNVLESDTAYTIQLAAPGLTKEDVEVKLDEEDALVISMEKKEEKSEKPAEENTEEAESKEVAKVETKPVHYLRREFMHQSFAQRLLLPEDADKERISAKMEHGVLEVIIPKIVKEEKTPIERNISID
mgnify:CR=1 FL=1